MQSMKIHTGLGGVLRLYAYKIHMCMYMARPTDYSDVCTVDMRRFSETSIIPNLKVTLFAAFFEMIDV